MEKTQLTCKREKEMEEIDNRRQGWGGGRGAGKRKIDEEWKEQTSEHKNIIIWKEMLHILMKKIYRKVH